MRSGSDETNRKRGHDPIRPAPLLGGKDDLAESAVTTRDNKWDHRLSSGEGAGWNHRFPLFLKPYPQFNRRRAESLPVDPLLPLRDSLPPGGLAGWGSLTGASGASGGTLGTG